MAAVASHAQTAAPVVDYQSEVHPILGAKCLVCHSQQKRSGGLALATYEDVLEGGRSGAVVRPGGSADSLLVLRASGAVEPRMPLAGEPLTDTELATIRSWIDEGARPAPTSPPAEPKWEAPLSLDRPEVPQPEWNGWTKPLDRFVAAYLREKGLSAPDPVSDVQFARRAYLDIWGLLPDPQQLRAFSKNRAPDKRKKLVARLLADNRKYAEHWISFWNDLLRNDQGVNYYSETASRQSITEWLFHSLESNLPYDRFVAKLLHPTEPDDPEGFLIGVNWRGTVNASQTPAMQAAQNTAQIFLGLNLKCNSCHDSFISKWKLKDAYSLASYFSPEDRLQLYRCDVAQQEYAEPAFLFSELNRAPVSASLDHRRAAAAAIFTDPRNGRLPRTLVNRIWQRLLGHGIVANPDEMDQEPWSAELLDWLASDFVESGYDLKHLLATIASSRAYEMPAVARKGEPPPRQYVFQGPEVRRLTAEQFADAIGSITGEWPVFLPDAGLRGPGTAQGDDETSKRGAFTRNWRVAASPLTRALGRPIRDQVYSTRESLATTLQALELVNGETLTRRLSRGAQKMLGILPPEPVSLFDRPIRGRNPRSASFDLDVSKARRLWLLVEDLGSYSPEKIEAVWAQAELVGPHGVTPLSSLEPLDASGVRAGLGPVKIAEGTAHGVRVKTPSRLAYDLAGKRFTRFRGMAGLENRDITFEINPDIRVFVFDQEPNMDRLTPVAPETPVPAPPTLRTISKVVDRVFWHALGRSPSAAERTLAEDALKDPRQPGRPSAEGLADLLWSVLMKPEFQLIY
jgi:hypothetical protein